MSPPVPRRVAIYAPPSAWRAAFLAVRQSGDRVVGLFYDTADGRGPELQRALRRLSERRYDALILQVDP